MRRLKIAILFIFIMCIVFTAEAQKTDTVKSKTAWISKISMPKFSMPKVTIPKVNFPKITMPKVHIPKFTMFSPKSKTEMDSTPVKAIVQLDTAAKTPKASWTSKIKFPSIRQQKKQVDSTPVKTIVKLDTAAIKPKASWTSKIKFPSIRQQKKQVDSTKLAVKLVEAPKAKAEMDTTSKSVKAKTTKKTKLNSVPKTEAIVVLDTAVKVDSYNFQLVKRKFVSSLNKFSTANTFSLLAGANSTKQTIASGGYASDFNYSMLDINNDVYKTGFFGGVRFDGKYQNKHEYSLSFTLNKINAGAKYTQPLKLTSFKGEDQFFVLNIAAHYKKQIPIGDPSKYKFYAIAGPSIDTRISGTSLENEVTAAYKRIFFKGDFGFEFNNRSMYTLFLNYQHNIGSLTKSPINTNINSFEFGVIAKAADLF
jgi:hypothetical protein